MFGYWIKYLFNNIEAAVLKKSLFVSLVDRNPENSIFLSLAFISVHNGEKLINANNI